MNRLKIKNLKLKINTNGFVLIPLLALALVAILALIAFFWFVKPQQVENIENSPALPPGIVTDAAGNICETQDAKYCHETPDIETWKDDGLP